MTHALKVALELQQLKNEAEATEKIGSKRRLEERRRLDQIEVFGEEDNDSDQCNCN